MPAEAEREQQTLREREGSFWHPQGSGQDVHALGRRIYGHEVLSSETEDIPASRVPCPVPPDRYEGSQGTTKALHPYSAHMSQKWQTLHNRLQQDRDLHTTV